MSVESGTEAYPSSGIFHTLRSLPTRIGVVLGSLAHGCALLLGDEQTGTLWWSELSMRKQPVKFSVNYFLMSV